ncbi:hypothetical protein [Acetobacter sp. LMG 32666]|uniref:hypothetical protein n=1 Tax=Acetobacter sp. LMG 32666 TaxID=2959295 RepID=UPI0030C7C90E
MSSDHKNHEVQALLEAGKSLEQAAQLEGIDEHTPLGRWIISVRAAMDAQARLVQASSAQMESFEARLERIIALAKQDTEHLRALLEKGFDSIQTLQNTGEVKLKEQELSLKQDQQALFNHFMLSLEKGLKDQVFERIRERLPTQEYTLYREVRWHAYVRLVLMAGGLILLGASVFLFATWDQSSRGRYCLAHTYHDSKTGQLWCDLSDAP